MPSYSTHHPPWPPSPTAEDEAASLTRELLSTAASSVEDGQPPPNTRGTVDQHKVIEDIGRPPEQRFVLVPPMQTDVADPPVFTERVSTPYAFTPRFDRHDSSSGSESELEDTTHLHTAERKPARYSFVKSDLQKEDLRTNLHTPQPTPEPDRRSSDHRQPTLPKDESSHSAKDQSFQQSPRSSSSSLDKSSRRSKHAAVETGHYGSRTPSRPASPTQATSSPRVPSKLRDSAPSSRPSSRGNTRPPSPLSFSMPMRPSSPARTPVIDTDWRATYPPIATNDRPGPTPKTGRYETMPLPRPAPRIDVLSPSPARPFEPPSSLPYPVDDRPLDVFMPSETQYQFDHSTVSPVRQGLHNLPHLSTTSPPSSPRLRDESLRTSNSKNMPRDESSRTKVSRSNSLRSQISRDDRVEHKAKTTGKLDPDRPLPSCPRSTPSSRYNDWYSLKGYRHFDICPSCYKGVFAGTPFAVHFKQIRLDEPPVERVCDFSSPWVRLAWLLTIKQRLPSFELVFSIADVTEVDRPCPQERELGSDRIMWYGIPDQRDGLHIANFAICSADKKMIEALFPTIRGYFTRLPSSYSATASDKYMCSLRTTSRRFPKYLDLLVELDAEAQDLSKPPNINRFIQMAREYAFKGECGKDKQFARKPWHFIPSLPEFTVCEECYHELIWPASQSRGASWTIPRLFNKAIQLVPSEDPDIGSSCCLYSPRMRKVWDVSVRDEDFSYLKRKVIERKMAEVRISRERKGIVNWLGGLERGSSQWQRAKSELKEVENEWAMWE